MRYIYNHINLFVYINSRDIEIIQIFHIILPFLKGHRVYIKSLLDFLKMQKKVILCLLLAMEVFCKSILGCR